MMCDITLTEKCGKLIDFPKKTILLMNAVYVLHIFLLHTFCIFFGCTQCFIISFFWCFPIQ